MCIRDRFHTKAKMLTFEEAHTMIGHDPGGVCSFALPDNVKTYLDISLKRFETVFPAAGSSNSAIEQMCIRDSPDTGVGFPVILFHDRIHVRLNRCV